MIRTRPFTAFRALLHGESGQALAEQGILLLSIGGAAGLGFLWLLRSQPGFLDAIGLRVRGVYFVLSLPLP